MDIDWQKLFVAETSLVELFLRGTVMYLALFATLRILVRRHVGSMSLMDLLLMVLIADAAQNAMAGEYKSITEGAVLCGTLISWNYFFDWLAYRYPVFQKFLEPQPLPVIKDGKFLRRNMRQEFITEDELLSQLRQHEVQDVSEVQLAFIEPDGAVTIVRSKKSGKGPGTPPKKRAASL
jgi:uncharacterized membrane protein YcaP (DUF421 family)